MASSLNKISLVATATDYELKVGFGIPRSISTWLTLVDDDYSTFELASGGSVSAHRFQFTLVPGEPKYGNGNPMEPGVCGVMSFLAEHVSRDFDVPHFPATVSGWSVLPEADFDWAWGILASSVAPCRVQFQLAPLGFENPDRWVWDTAVNQHLQLSGLTLAFKREGPVQQEQEEEAPEDRSGTRRFAQLRRSR